jgi:hypothetical protein
MRTRTTSGSSSMYDSPGVIPVMTKGSLSRPKRIGMRVIRDDLYTEMHYARARNAH